MLRRKQIILSFNFGLSLGDTQWRKHHRLEISPGHASLLFLSQKEKTKIVKPCSWNCWGSLLSLHVERRCCKWQDHSYSWKQNESKITDRSFFTDPLMNSSLLSFLSPFRSNLTMISSARRFGSLSLLRSKTPARSYWKQTPNIARTRKPPTDHCWEYVGYFCGFDVAVAGSIPPREEQCSSRGRSFRVFEAHMSNAKASRDSKVVIRLAKIITTSNSLKSTVPSLSASIWSKIALYRLRSRWSMSAAIDRDSR